MMIFLSWIVFSVIVGAIGSGRKIGFAGAFFLSLILSPIIGLIVVLFSKDKEEEAHKEKVLEAQQKQVELLNNLKNETAKTNVADDLIKLKTLLDQNVITQEEFEQEKKKILNS